MRIGIVSDLHADNWNKRNFKEIGSKVQKELSEAEIILLAGDIGEGRSSIESAYRLFPNKTVCIVAGNHEFYGNNYDDTINELTSTAAKYPNIHFLNRTVYYENGLRVVGATLWTDFDLYGTQLESMAKASTRLYGMRGSYTPYSDFSFIYGLLNANEMLEWHVRDKTWMFDELNKPFDGITIALMHHCPLSTAIHEKFKHDILTPCFVSNLENEFTSCKVDAVVWGHTHFSSDEMLNGVRFISNQVGYLGETEDRGKIMELKH